LGLDDEDTGFTYGQKVNKTMPRKVGNLEIIMVVGMAIHGPYWQKSMAAELGVNRRTVSRWLEGSSPVPDELPDGTFLGDALQKAIANHEKNLAKAKKQLDRYIHENMPRVPQS
jgi:hypothetical protein